MIRGMHAMFYSTEAPALRAFLRDKLGFTSFTDVGDGWLIFDLPEADIGCHPVEAGVSGQAGAHSISFYCDDIEQTVRELTDRGVEFTEGITDAGYGFRTHFDMPGGVRVELYQPRYQKPIARAE